MSVIEVDEILYGSIEGTASTSQLPCLKLRTIVYTDIGDMGNTWAQRDVFNTTALINVGGFGVTSGAITIPEDGKYFVTSNIIHKDETQASTAQDNYRNTIWHRWEINGVAQVEEARSSYNRDYANHDRSSTSISTMYNLNQGDVLKLQFRNYTGFNDPNDHGLVDNSHIMMFKFSDK
mgnify:CR=1 FL=1